MTHLSVVESLNGRSADWMEQVTDAQYRPCVGRPASNAARAAGDTMGTTRARPSAAQQLMGDIAPNLVQLTDRVLFGDV